MIARFDLSYFAKGILGDYPVMIKAGLGNPNEIFPSFPTKCDWSVWRLTKKILLVSLRKSSICFKLTKMAIVQNCLVYMRPEKG